MEKLDSLNYLISLARRAGSLSAQIDESSDNCRSLDLDKASECQRELDNIENQIALISAKIVEWGVRIHDRKLPCQAKLLETGERFVVYSISELEGTKVCGCLPFGSNNVLDMKIVPEAFLEPYD